MSKHLPNLNYRDRVTIKGVKGLGQILALVRWATTTNRKHLKVCTLPPSWLQTSLQIYNYPPTVFLPTCVSKRLPPRGLDQETINHCEHLEYRMMVLRSRRDRNKPLIDRQQPELEWIQF